MCVHQGTIFLSKSFVHHFAHGHESRGSRRWCHGLVVVVVIKLPCCHVHAWMAPDQSSNAAQSSSARPPMVLTCRRHACHVSHVDGGCHVVVMWIGATVCVVLATGGKRRRGGTECAGRGQAAPWFVAGASPYGGDMSLSCLCKTWIVRCHAAMSVCLVGRGGGATG